MSGIKRWLTALAAAVLTMATAVILWSGGVNHTPLPRETPQQATYRVIGAWEGRVAVFCPDSAQPECVFDTPLAVLPIEEQRRLQAGVRVENATALYERLEDYIG